LDDSAITGLLDIISNVTNGITDLIGKMGGLKTIIGTIGGAFLANFGGRTHEVINTIKENLGIMTGSAKKTTIEMNEALAQRQGARAARIQETRGFEEQVRRIDPQRRNSPLIAQKST
jgi:hypothetical protein